MEAIVTLQFNGTDVTVEVRHQYQARHRIGTFHIRYGLYALFKRSIPLSRDAPLPERSRPEHNAMHRIFQDCIPDR